MPHPQDPSNPPPEGWGAGWSTGPSGVGGAGGPAAGGVPSAERVREQIRLFLVLLLGLIIVDQLSLPFKLGGLALSVAIGWVGIRLLSSMAALSRSGTPVRGWPSVIIGLALAGWLTLSLIFAAAFYPLISERERCLSEANTLQAKDACEKALQDRINELTREFPGQR